jgi:hypothetical protein
MSCIYVKWLRILSFVAVSLILVSSLSAIFLDDGGKITTISSLRNQQVQMYGGEGIYRFDTVYKAVMFRGFDWANLFVTLPLFLLSLLWIQKDRVRGLLLIGGLFSYLAYAYLIGVMGNAFNGLFIIWTTMYSIGMGGIAVVFAAGLIPKLSQKQLTYFPRRSLAIYTIILGIILMFMYLSSIIPAYIKQTPPPLLDTYTTLELAALELGIMVPLHIIAGIMLWRQMLLGYALSIILAITAAVMFISLNVSQMLLFFRYQIGTIADVLTMLILVLVASYFSLQGLRGLKNGSLLTTKVH